MTFCVVVGIKLSFDIHGQMNLQIIFVIIKGEATNHYREAPVGQAGANRLHHDQDERGGMYGSACQKPLWGPKSTGMSGLPASTDKAISLWSLNSADSVLWRDLKPDWIFSRTESCKKACSCIKTNFSKTLERRQIRDRSKTEQQRRVEVSFFFKKVPILHSFIILVGTMSKGLLVRLHVLHHFSEQW